MEAVEAYFAAHPEQREQWWQYAEQREALRMAFAAPAAEPIPRRLRLAQGVAAAPVSPPTHGDRRSGRLDHVRRDRPVTTDGGFMDPDIPSGFAPFGIQNINGNLFVTYAKQNAAKHDDVAGAGNGFVDVFDTDGHLLRRFASQGPLNSPWGVARASFAFGRFSGDILVGNFGNGKIHAFDSNGRFLGTLRDVNGKPIVIDGLWTLTLGGGRNSNSDTLYFTAGPNDETNGLFGTITPVSNTDN
jgi:uncharacterized protein (TIGR03118 family)